MLSRPVRGPGSSASCPAERRRSLDGQAGGAGGVSETGVVDHDRVEARPESQGGGEVDGVEAPQLRRRLVAGAIEHAGADTHQVDPSQHCRRLGVHSLREVGGDVRTARESKDGAPQLGANQRAADQTASLMLLDEGPQGPGFGLLDDQLDQGARVKVEQGYRQSSRRSAARSSDIRARPPTSTGVPARMS